MLLKITEHFIELNVSDYIKVYYIVLPFEPEYVQGCATATCPQFVRDIKFYLPSCNLGFPRPMQWLIPSL